ncbi:MAG: methyl-accepting chemotaxis protein [Actinomycetota bacterium]|nr:methyl-accepting chemotaxis protein [Actinomycetota bacterium]
MAGAYTLAWDTAENRINFTLTGMWDADTMRRWDADYRAAVAKAPRDGWTVIGDMTGYPAQSEEIQAGHERLIAHSAASGMAKAVLVVPKAVVAMQMKRLVNNAKASTVTYAASVDEAKKLLAALPA